EFLQKYAGNKEANSAKYGLALCLVEGGEKDYPAAVEQLQAIAGAKEMPEHPYVLYYLGLARRGIGVTELEQAAAKPQEAPSHRAAAAQQFTQAEQQFAAAATGFTAKLKAGDAKALPLEGAWAARARCDQAEMQLRTQKVREARETTAPFTDDKSPLGRSR